MNQTPIMSKHYDYIIVGSGWYGSIFAHNLHNRGNSVLVLEKRNHIGGNCYTENRNGINIHTYGPHIFHTNNKKVWDWVNQFAEFNDFTLRPVANYNGEIYSLPFNMWTFSHMFGITHPTDAKKMIELQSKHIGEPKNFEEQAIKLVGTTVYEKLIKGYTEKQWRKPANELPASIIKRLPVRFSYDNNYFNDKYQGIPIGGYTQIFEKLLDGIDIKYNTDYLMDKDTWNSMADTVIYTGPIDKFFDYKYGHLEYKTTTFLTFKENTSNYQGTAMMNYTDSNVPWTRIVEHKHFENTDSDTTWLTMETPAEYVIDKTEPMYPVNDEINNNLYQKYKNDADSLTNIHFGGRLAEYKYYDMHNVIDVALQRVSEFL